MRLIAIAYRIFLILWLVFRGAVTCALVLPWVGPRYRDRLIQSWSASLLRKLQITVQVYGSLPEPGQVTFLLTSNHVSWVDIFVIHSVCPVRFVSKAEVRHWPLFGWLAAKTGTLFLVRGSHKQIAAIGGKMEVVLKQGDSLGLFPESTTSEGNLVLPFHSSMLQAAISCEVPILPVALRYRLIDGTINPHLPFVGEMTFAQSLINVLIAPPSRVALQAGSLVKTVQIHRRELAQQLERITTDLLKNEATCCVANAFRTEPEITPDLPVSPL